MEVTKYTGIYCPQFFKKLTITKHLNYEKALCADNTITKGSNTKPLHATHTKKKDYTTSLQKPILGLCQGHTRIFKVQKKTRHTHAVQSSQKAFPHSHFQEMFQDEKHSLKSLKIMG